MFPKYYWFFLLWYKSQMTKRETFAWLFTQIRKSLSEWMQNLCDTMRHIMVNITILFKNFPTSAVADSERLILIRLDELYWQRFQENDYI